MIERPWNPYLKGFVITALILAAYAWTQADQWQQELEAEQAELALRQRLATEQARSRGAEDGEPELPEYTYAEPEPRFYSAPVQKVKRAVVKTKKKLRNG